MQDVADSTSGLNDFSYDREWFERIRKINAQIPLKLIPKNYNDAKHQFLASHLSEPAYHYKAYDLDEHNKKIQALHSLENDIFICQKTHPAVKRIYLHKLEEKKNQFKLIFLVFKYIHGEYTTTSRLTDLIENVYGVPNQNTYNQLMSYLSSQFHAMPFSVTKSRHFQFIKPLFEKVYESSIQPLERIAGREFNSDKIYSRAIDVKHWFKQELSNYGLEQWNVEISANPTGGFYVRPNRKTIFVPKTSIISVRKGERRLNERVLTSLFYHEVLTHALRAENGSKSPLKLLSTGLANYWQGEEGIASYREQMIAGANDYAGANLYFAISMAYGLDRGGEKRIFRETFNLLHSYYYVFHGFSGQYSRQRAYATCNRIYIGESGLGTALIMPKDIAYREGNIAIHQLLKKNPEKEKSFNVGKYDPTNEEHTQPLTNLGLLPD